MNIHVRCGFVAGGSFAIDVEPTDTIGEMRQKMSEAKPVQRGADGRTLRCDAENLDLFHDDQIMRDEKTVTDYGILDGGGITAALAAAAQLEALRGTY